MIEHTMEITEEAPCKICGKDLPYHKYNNVICHDCRNSCRAIE